MMNDELNSSDMGLLKVELTCAQSAALSLDDSLAQLSQAPH